MGKPLLFVSYAHKDRGVKAHLDDMLESLGADIDVENWSDEQLAGGDSWEQGILERVEHCDLALLCLSTAFFASKFIREKELNRLQERSQGDNPPHIYPVLLSDCDDGIPAWIEGLQIRPDPKGKSLNGMPDKHRIAAIQDIERELGRIIQDLRPAASPADDEAVPTLAIEIDVALGHRDEGLYLGEMRVRYPDEETPMPVIAFEARFDCAESDDSDTEELGVYLGEQLFPSSVGIEESSRVSDGGETPGQGARVTPADLIEQALEHAAASNDIALRLRIAISSNARELNRLPWERLRSPRSRRSFAVDSNVFFSRTLVGNNENWREVHLRRAPAPDRQLDILIFVPGRADVLNEQGERIGEVDAERQREYAEKCLADCGQEFRSEVGGFDELFRSLHQRPVDVLFLVVDKNVDADGLPVLEFETNDRRTQQYRYHQVARAFRDLPETPRLVVLATPCVDSSGDVTQDCAVFGIRKFAPAIAEAGVPAVITTQAATKPESWRAFLTGVFHRLHEHEGLDRAVSLSRRALAAGDKLSGDWWKPVLIGRLRNSRIWYRPGFQGRGTKKGRARILSALHESLGRQRLLPIIGPGIIHDIAGSRREIARRWAYEFGFPMEHHNRMNLPQVAQYLQIQTNRLELERNLESTLKDLIRGRHGDALGAVGADASLDDLFRAVNAEQRKAAGNDEPHGLLAKLDTPLYLTTNLSSILEQALEQAGRPPRTFTFKGLAQLEREGKDELDWDEPTTERPWVVHLFGTLDDLENAALTEDDYFDFLSDFALTSRQEVIAHVKSRMVGSSLLFLGFRLHHWTFRTLFRSIYRLEGKGMQYQRKHVAVQFDPDDDQITNPEGAKDYLQLLFNRNDVSVYWGGAEDFLKELLFMSTASSPLQSGNVP
jgi:hypothetical protein